MCELYAFRHLVYAFPLRLQNFMCSLEKRFCSQLADSYNPPPSHVVACCNILAQIAGRASSKVSPLSCHNYFDLCGSDANFLWPNVGQPQSRASPTADVCRPPPPHLPHLPSSQPWPTTHRCHPAAAAANADGLKDQGARRPPPPGLEEEHSRATGAGRRRQQWP